MPRGLEIQALGGVPTPQPDVGINITFLILFTICGVFNFQTFWRNHKQQRLFAFNAAIVGFCSIRTIATSLRIAWAYDPDNIHLAMAAHIFVYTGVVILIICNLWWSQRIIRAQHPTFGWNVVTTTSLPVMVGLAILTTLLLIASTCMKFYLSAPRAQYAARCIQQYGHVLFAVLSVIPIPVLLTSAVAKTHPDLQERNEDNFGRHSIMRKVLVCLTTALLLSIGALFRAIIAFAPEVHVTESTPWYYSKACFHVFNFTLEILVVVFWLFVRVDRLFIVPDGARGPQSYGGGFVFPGEPGNEKPPMTPRSRHHIARATKGFDMISTRSSTIPPPSRSGSWGDARQFMCDSPTIAIKSPRLERQSAWDDASRTRVDSTWGDESRTGVTYVDPKDSLDLQLPAPCMRCLKRASYEEVDDYAAPAYAPEYRNTTARLGFDPRSAQWIQRPLSLSGPSVSQYSVRETLRPASTVMDSRMSEDASPGSFLGVGWAR